MISYFLTKILIGNYEYKDKLHNKYIYTMTKKSSLTFLKLFICAVILFLKYWLLLTYFLAISNIV